jgi:hypothetical protein
MVPKEQFSYEVRLLNQWNRRFLVRFYINPDGYTQQEQKISVQLATRIRLFTERKIITILRNLRDRNIIVEYANPNLLRQPANNLRHLYALISSLILMVSSRAFCA